MENSKQKSTQYSPSFTNLDYSPYAPTDMAISAIQKGSARALSGGHLAERMQSILHTSRLRLNRHRTVGPASRTRREGGWRWKQVFVWLSTEHLPNFYAGVCRGGTAELRHRWPGPRGATEAAGSGVVQPEMPRPLGTEPAQNLSSIKECHEDEHDRIQAAPLLYDKFRALMGPITEVGRIVDHTESGTDRRSVSTLSDS